MSWRRPELSRRPWLPLAATGLAALAPKCFLCLAGYAGVGAALGLGGAEICGATADWAWSSWLAVAGVVVTGLALARRGWRRSANLAKDRG